jgi:CRP-like cAMP-binding protein
MVKRHPRSDAQSPTNCLLAQLPPDDFRRIRAHLTTVGIHPRQLLHKQHERLRYVYFPNSGIVSMATVLEDGAVVEAATIGDDGVVGIDAFYGEDAISSCETLVQVPVPHETAEMMPVSAFRREIAEHRALRDVVALYAHRLHARLVRLTACNARHDINERCARWLLVAHDHMHGHDFHLSQEFLAVMLGVRRQSVSAVASTFQAAGLIRYHHGDVKILNRHGLEEAACECYDAIRQLSHLRP